MASSVPLFLVSYIIMLAEPGWGGKAEIPPRKAFPCEHSANRTPTSANQPPPSRQGEGTRPAQPAHGKILTELGSLPLPLLVPAQEVLAEARTSWVGLSVALLRYQLLSVSLAAITEHHRLGGLNNNIYFSQSGGLTSSRSRHRQIPCQ